MIFVAGIQPAAAFGAEVWGMDDGEVRKLRRLAAAALRPTGRTRSLRTTLIWHGLFTAAAEHAPLIQLSRMVWEAVVRRERAENRGSSISHLRQWWESAAAKFTPLSERLESMLNVNHRSGEELPLSRTRGIWRQIRGPMGAAALTAARIGWKFEGPFRLLDHNGAEVLLTNTPPALIKKMATDALRATLERRLANGWAEGEPEYNGRRACLDLVINAVKCDRNLSADQKGIMRAVTCGAVMTGAKAVKLGYCVSGLCPLCQQALDTMAHRVYECPHTSEAVQAVVPKWFWDEARRRAAGARFWTTGACPSPADLAPMPGKSLDVVVEKRVALENGAREEEELIAVGGRLYWDGSCTTPSVKRLARAACSVVQTDAEGNPTKILQAAVPRHLPQTAQAAEFLGLAIAMHAIRRQAVVIGDSLNVVRAANGVGRDILQRQTCTRAYCSLPTPTPSDGDWQHPSNGPARTESPQGRSRRRSSLTSGETTPPTRPPALPLKDILLSASTRCPR